MHHIAIPARREALASIEDEVDAFAGRHGISTQLRHRLSLVLEELAMNSVLHGNCPEGSLIEIWVQWHAQTVSGSHVEIRYLDCGIPFDPTRDIPERPERDNGGWGWSMIRRFGDPIDYERDAERNCIRVTLR